MRLHNLIKSGGTKKRKRVGRGESSGHGKTSGRGNKGQRARAGYSLRPGFESGHIPLYRKLPKRGFSNERFATEYAIVNVGQLAKLAETDIDRNVLVQRGLVRSSDRLVKILGVGTLDRAVVVTADKFSASAKAKIEQAGGTVKAVVAADDAAE
jgi:large subunit ribosomal protein L15